MTKKTYYNPKITTNTKKQEDTRILNKYTISSSIIMFCFCFFGVEIDSFVHAAQCLTGSLSKDSALGLKSATVGFPLDNGGLVQVCFAVLALRWVVSVMGHLGVPHLTLTLPQLGHVALEAEAELRVVSLGRLHRSLLQMHRLHIHHLLSGLSSVTSVCRRFGV